MPDVFSFHPVRYADGRGDVSTLVAPPYDVLDRADKAALLGRDEHNIVAVDLPHVPPHQLGPSEAYERAGRLYREWLQAGTLSRSQHPILCAYRQTFEFGGRRHVRSGMTCTIETVPFGPREGGGVLPHEETFSGPKEDRLALMKATAAQLSPIFCLHADAEGRATQIVQRVAQAGPAHMTATMADGVLHEVWEIDDEGTIRAYQDALAGEDIFIADGHHRYNTALNYLAFLQSHETVGGDHPARRCMVVLVGMSDPGLVIGPTHRVIGGMKHYSKPALLDAAREAFDIRPCHGDAADIESAMAEAAADGREHVFGLIDMASRECFVASARETDPLNDRMADRSRATRTLDVTVIQRLLVEDICRPMFNDGDLITWDYPHTVEDVLRSASPDSGAQLAVIVRPTPLQAVRDISAAGELMPQKSTYFYPKLATGLFLNPLV